MTKYYSFFGTESLILGDILSISKGASICLFCEDNEEIEKQYEILKFFLPDKKVLKFPAWDCTPYDVVSPSRTVVFERLKTLSSIRGDEIILTTYESLVQKVPPISKFSEGFLLEFENGKSYSFQGVISALSKIGYNRMVNAISVGEFAVRGSIIDIVSQENGEGFRLDFFGDRVESIRVYDVTTQNSLSRVNKICVTPTSEIEISESSKAIFKEKYYSSFGIVDDLITDSINEGRFHNGIEHYLPFFYEELSSFLEFLKDNSILVMRYDYLHRANDILGKVREKFERRATEKNQKVKAIPVELLYEFKSELLNKFSVKELSSFESDKNIFGRSVFENLFLRAKHQNTYALDYFKHNLSVLGENKIIFCCYSNGGLERLSKLLLEHEIAVKTISNFNEVTTKYSIAILPIEKGYEYKNTIFLSEFEFLGHQPSNRRKAKKVSANVFTELQSLSPGDLVVHIEHGIGRFESIEQIRVGAVVHDFIMIAYSGGDKFYLPVENLELLTRYGVGEDTLLDKLGSLGWQSRKAKLKNKIKLSAEKLLKVAAERNLSSVEPIIPAEDFYQTFVQKFQYAETDDQLRSIDEVLADLCGTRPMDRLICGDVGFGKTEVALRAAAAVVSSGFGGQVAILVPTTLLARQHFRTFSERFDGLPVRVRQLSKFTPPKSVKAIRMEVEQGEADVVIGTHMLLSKDMKFKNLKLLIIDEEQHFGVAQKEKLKELKADCHVLTLSATPIPRTLQMSLFGIKDLSLITTPPVNRHPIVTNVIPFDILTIRDAILREHYRGGRTFFVTPRVAFLDGIMDLIKANVPEVKAIKAHGGMTSDQLDVIMNDFYDGKYEVLVSTTIIESGLDIPFANTIIIDRADMFGLAQLYQIRGRVGRSSVQAYSYLTYSNEKRLTDNAEKRLSVLSSFEELGAGFTIASNDMDIRGYGNLLGDEQSGHVREVGIELYQHMLQEAVQEIKLQVGDSEDDSWSPTINIGISVQIPQTYIPDDSLRINLYRKIASLSNLEELESFAVEMVDRFGKLPTEVEHLFGIVKIKQFAKEAGVEKIDLGDKALLITFREKATLNHQAIIEFVNANSDKAKLRPDNKLIITREPKGNDEIINLVTKITSSII